MRWSLPLGRFSARRSVVNRAPARRLRSLRSESLEARQLLALTFMGDLNPEFEPADIRSLLADGNQLYFSLETVNEGQELWTSDGTAEGTRMVKDILPGPGSSYPHMSRAHGGLMYFSASDGHSSSLWRTDGTELGTIQLTTSFGFTMAALGDDLFFTQSSGAGGLWRTNGTPEGTVQVFTSDTYVGQLEAFGDDLVFVKTTAEAGTELWRFDPQTESAEQIADIFQGTGSGLYENFASGLTVHNGIMYFAGFDGVSGRELWRSDGTAAGTYLLSDINPGPGHAFPNNLDNGIRGFGDYVFVTAEDGTHGNEVWRVNTLTGEGRLTGDLIPVESSGDQIYDPRLIGAFDGAFVFEVPESSFSGLFKVNDDGSATQVRDDLKFAFGVPVVSGEALYYVKPTATGQALVKFTSLATPPKQIASLNSGFGYFTPSEQGLYFSALDAESGMGRLWKSDGTREGTTPFTGPLIGEAASSSLSGPAVVGESVFFQTDKRDADSKLWLMRPEFETAREVKFQAADNCGDCFLDVEELAPTNDTGVLYFWANSPIADMSGLWRADEFGEHPTFISADVRLFPTEYPSRPFLVGTLGDDAYFFRKDVMPSQLVLMKTNHASEQPVALATFPYETSFGSRLGIFAVEFDGSLIFSVSATGRRQLWRTDGTPDGTQMTWELSGRGQFGALAVANDKLFVNVAFSDPELTGLWAGDGTLAGSTRVNNPDFLTKIFTTSQGVYFAGVDDEHGDELWFSDGSTARRLSDIRPGPDTPFNSSNPSSFEIAELNGFVYFTASPAPGEYALWRTNGTEAGTVPGLPGNTSGLRNVLGTLFFTRLTQEYGVELWRSDGTPEGTAVVADMLPGPLHGQGRVFATVGKAVYFYADTLEYGGEIWRLSLDAGDTNFDGLIDATDHNNVRNNFGGSGLGDTNGDGVVNIADLNAVRNQFVAAVPLQVAATPVRERFVARDAVFAMLTGEESRTEKRGAKRRS